MSRYFQMSHEGMELLRMVVLGKFLLFRPGGMKVLCMDVDVNMFRNIQDRMVHTEKEAREMAEPEDQVGSGDGKQGVI